MNTRAPLAQQPTTSATTRAITRMSLAVPTAVLFAGAIFVGETEFITAALLTGVAGIAVDLRQTTNLARVPARS